MTWKVPFTSFLKSTRTKKKSTIEKNPQNYESIHNETCVYEQKPIKIVDFHETEEKKLKNVLKKEKQQEGRLPRKINFKKTEKTRTR